MRAGPFLEGDLSKKKLEKGAWRTGRREGRRGLTRHLLPLLLTIGVAEGCTYGGAFSSTEVAEICTQLQWGINVSESRPACGSDKGCTRWYRGATLSLMRDCDQGVRTERQDSIERTSHEGWTPWGGSTSYGGHNREFRGGAKLSRTMRNDDGHCINYTALLTETLGEDGTRPSRITKGCTQVHWGTTLVGDRLVRGSGKGCTQLCWGATLSFPRTNDGNSKIDPYEGWTPWGGSTSYWGHFDGIPMIKGCTQLHCGATMTRANDTNQPEHEGYTCRLQGVTSW